MNNKLNFVLSIVCVVLILIIGGEWLFAKQAQKKLLNTVVSTGKKVSSDEMPTIELTAQTEESYADMVARPLFIKGRRPVEEPPPAEQQAIAAKPIKFDWALNGVYTLKKELSALFSRTTAKVRKDNYRKIKVGDDLDGWKLSEIHKDKVILKQGSDEKELLLRKPKLKEAPQNRNNSTPQELQGKPGAIPNQPGSEPPVAVQPGAEPVPEPEPEPVPEPEPEPELEPELEPTEDSFDNGNNEQF